jgi:Flp pilus assembly protein CpaB
MQTVQSPQRAPKPKQQPRWELRNLVSTRKGTTLVAGVSALLAAGGLMVFLGNYKASLNNDEAPATVLVAKSLLEKGSSGTIIAEKDIFQTERVRKSELKVGAIADPSNLRGKVAADDIYPGEQLVISDFAPATGGVRERIAGNERAIAIPVDAAHGLLGDVQTGDHVDVYVLFGGAAGGGANTSILKTLLQDVMVLRGPAPAAKGAAAGNAQEIVLRATGGQAAKLAFASDNGKIWIVLRPQIGAGETRPELITQAKLLLEGTPLVRRAR